MYPTFKIHKIKEEPNGLELTGSLSTALCKNGKWVDDNWLGYLKDSASMVYGRWRKENDDWKFLIKVEDISNITFYVGQEVTVFDSYWGERVELVTNGNITWKEAVYKAKDTWDHDHCAICWATISESENKDYMLGDNRAVVCFNCFGRYIKQSDLGFIYCA